jgi:hypothetical protein
MVQSMSELLFFVFVFFIGRASKPAAERREVILKPTRLYPQQPIVGDNVYQLSGAEAFSAPLTPWQLAMMVDEQERVDKEGCYT